MDADVAEEGLTLDWYFLAEVDLSSTAVVEVELFAELAMIRSL